MLSLEEQTLLRNAALGWARSLRDENPVPGPPLALPRGFDPDAWRELAELGWLAICVPEASGGIGGDLADLAIVIEALGEAIPAEPVAAVAGVAAPLLAQLADSPSTLDLLTEVVAGTSVVTLGHFEPEGPFDRQVLTTQAEQLGAEWRLSGTKAPVLQADAADVLLVSARDSEGEVGLFAVDAAAPGLALSTFRTVDGRRASYIEMKGVPAVRIGCDAALAIDQALDRGAVLAMVEAAALESRLVTETANYLKDRVQFGVPLSSFQALQHRCVDLFVMVQEALASARAAARLTDIRTVAIAKVVGGRAALATGREAIQLFGGMGMSDELFVGHAAKRLMMLEVAYGNTDHYLAAYAAVMDDAGDDDRLLAVG